MTGKAVCDLVILVVLCNDAVALCLDICFFIDLIDENRLITSHKPLQENGETLIEWGFSPFLLKSCHISLQPHFWSLGVKKASSIKGEIERRTS